MVESSALLKRRSPKGYRGFESLPHRADVLIRAGPSVHPFLSLMKVRHNALREIIEFLAR